MNGITENDSFFTSMTSLYFNPDEVIDISQAGRILVISDFHMGSGRRDDLVQNGELLINLLQNYYFPGGWYLVLNGDIEELLRYSLDAIQERWVPLYRVFDQFASENRLFKIIGNHDEDLLFVKNYPYPLHLALRIETGRRPIYVYHGHQGSRVYMRHKKLIGAGVRFVLKPFGIRNISASRSPNRRFFVEKEAYKFSLENNCISIIGHTHRPLFESLGRFDYIKFEIERLCRDYPAAAGESRERIASEVQSLRRDLGKLRRKEKRDVLHQSLYGEDLVVPCLFNSGSAIGRKGINAIELTGENMALVYWFVEGEGKHFVSRGGYKLARIKGTKYRRAILNQDKMDYIQAKIELLGTANG